jgi:hemerythrin-like domain-containing protein
VESTRPGAAHGTRYSADDPLEQISREHLRQREVCANLDKLAVLETPDPALAASVLPHFETLLKQHVHEEEENLFPLLRRRSDPGDDINETLDRLVRKHRVSLDLAVRVCQIVWAMALEGAVPDAEAIAALTGFAAHARRYLIVENAIVLPLARARLSAGDLNDLRDHMARRRAKKDSGGSPEAG